MMEERVERGRKEMGEVREVCGKVRGVIEGVERGEGEGVRGVRDVGWKEAEKLGNGERERERERGKSLVQEKRMWEVIEDEVGGFD